MLTAELTRADHDEIAMVIGLVALFTLAALSKYKGYRFRWRFSLRTLLIAMSRHSHWVGWCTRPESDLGRDIALAAKRKTPGGAGGYRIYAR